MGLNKDAIEISASAVCCMAVKIELIKSNSLNLAWTENDEKDKLQGGQTLRICFLLWLLYHGCLYDCLRMS